MKLTKAALGDSDLLFRVGDWISNSQWMVKAQLFENPKSTLRSSDTLQVAFGLDFWPDPAEKGVNAIVAVATKCKREMERLQWIHCSSYGNSRARLFQGRFGHNFFVDERFAQAFGLEKLMVDDDKHMGVRFDTEGDPEIIVMGMHVDDSVGQLPLDPIPQQLWNVVAAARPICWRAGYMASLRGALEALDQLPPKPRKKS
jgi:hypothetical protein